jgi:glycosyltransferase involved in cell wall biosynthesis
MKVLQVITDTYPRGAQVAAIELGNELRQRGVEIETVALAPGQGGAPLRVSVLGSRRLGTSTLSRLRRRSREVDVVVAHGSTTLPACALALARTRTPFVYRQVSDSLVWASTPARRARVRAGLAQASLVVALGERQRDVLRTQFGVPDERLSVIPNAASDVRFVPATCAQRVEARRAFGLPLDTPVVLSIGALVPEKGVDSVVRAVAAMTDKSVRLLVVGIGPEETVLKRLADDLIPGRAVFAQVIDDAVMAYAAADVVVLASRTESMPGVLIEAALCGLPAVATDVGAVREVVAAGETGAVVPFGDQDQLNAALANVLSEPDRRAALGQAAVQRARSRYTLAVVAPMWKAALDELVANHVARIDR